MNYNFRQKPEIPENFPPESFPLKKFLAENFPKILAGINKFKFFNSLFNWIKYIKKVNSSYYQIIFILCLDKYKNHNVLPFSKNILTLKQARALLRFRINIQRNNILLIKCMYDKLFMAQITDKNGLLILKSFRREYSAGIGVCETKFPAEIETEFLLDTKNNTKYKIHF